MYLGPMRALIRSPTSYSAQVQQYLDRATGMDATHINAFTALIDGLVADSVWSSLDCLYVFATDTEDHAKLNVKSSSFTITETGTVAWVADQGYTGVNADGTNFLNTTFNPSTAGGSWAQNSAHQSMWCNTNAQSAVAAQGAATGTEDSFFNPRNTSDQFIGRINNDGGVGGVLQTSVTSSVGHWVASRTASNLITGYKNGASVGTTSDVSDPVVNLAFGTCGRNSSGTIACTNRQFSVVSMGGGLDGTQAAALYSRIATYRTAVGL